MGKKTRDDSIEPANNPTNKWAVGGMQTQKNLTSM